MKTVLIYGDSNTWGQDSNNNRYPYEVRWVSKLQAELGSGYDILPAGLSGRVAGNHEQVEEAKRGRNSFEVVFRQSFPVDLVIIALGSNDIKEKYNIPAEQITDDLLWYVQYIESVTDYNDKPMQSKVVFIVPPNFVYSKTGFAGDEQKRQEVITSLQESAYDTVILDEVALSDDGVHFSPEGHQQMAQAVYKKLKEIEL